MEGEHSNIHTVAPSTQLSVRQTSPLLVIAAAHEKTLADQSLQGFELVGDTWIEHVTPAV
jgi:hypothetical protein